MTNMLVLLSFTVQTNVFPNRVFNPVHSVAPNTNMPMFITNYTRVYDVGTTNGVILFTVSGKPKDKP